MKTITIDNIRGDQLPQEWAKQAEISPDEIVAITIGPPRKQQVEKLLELINKIGQDAKKKGLTEQKLSQLLNE